MWTHAWVVAGAKVGLCELPRALISSDDKGGMGGTCVLRGCVPKKLMALAGLFAEELQDAASFGCGIMPPESMTILLSVKILPMTPLHAALATLSTCCVYNI